MKKHRFLIMALLLAFLTAYQSRVNAAEPLEYFCKGQPYVIGTEVASQTEHVIAEYNERIRSWSVHGHCYIDCRCKVPTGPLQTCRQSYYPDPEYACGFSQFFKASVLVPDDFNRYAYAYGAGASEAEAHVNYRKACQNLKEYHQVSLEGVDTMVQFNCLDQCKKQLKDSPPLFISQGWGDDDLDPKIPFRTQCHFFDPTCIGYGEPIDMSKSKDRMRGCCGQLVPSNPTGLGVCKAPGT